jgi:dihydrofolate synthase/folylpolyglutamate synthase
MSRFSSLEAWLQWQENLHPRSIDLGLARIRVVLQKLNPQKHPAPVTITVAGTNGKGSCVAFLEAIYLAQGYRVGTYTSPHILTYNERIKINGIPVTDELICQAFDRIDRVRETVSLSYFEFGTLAALDIFSRSQLDVQLLEVGLGGRLDAVNIIDPAVAIISSIGIDHVDWLGNTRESIATEKAGIFRAATPAIVADLQPPQTLIDRANQLQANLFCINQQFGYHKNNTHWDWFCDEFSFFDLPLPALKGEHQFRNASASILAVTQLQKQLPVGQVAICQGLETAQLTGRFQLVGGEIPVLLDVAHNPQAVESLLEHLDTYFAGQKIQAVFTMMKDKDILSVISLLKNRIDNWFVAPLTHPRIAPPEMIKDCFKKQGVEKVWFEFESFSHTLKAAKKQARQGDLILIFGSFFLVSAYLADKKTI